MLKLLLYAYKLLLYLIGLTEISILTLLSASFNLTQLPHKKLLNQRLLKVGSIFRGSNYIYVLFLQLSSTDGKKNARHCRTLD